MKKSKFNKRKKENREMKVISIINEKGGVGKTTASVNISYGLVERLMNDGKRILLIDADAQGNATKFFLPEFKSITLEEFNMLEVPQNCDIRSSTKFIKNSLISMLGERNYLNKLLLEGKGVIRECIHQTQYQQLDIIPSIGTELIATDKLLGASTGQRHVILKRALREIRNDYDIVIIDHAPTFNNITVNGLFCSNEIIIPLKPGGFELKGLIDTLEELFDIEDDYECEYKIRILMNMIPRGVRPAYISFINKIREFYGDTILQTTVGYQDAVASRSTMSGKLLYNSKTGVGEDYRNLVDELIKEFDNEI